MLFSKFTKIKSQKILPPSMAKFYTPGVAFKENFMGEGGSH